ncbi:MAG: MFS transporter [Deltaproteobacteria bacterium]|jgi:MFS family permease|nr:MFS transporter [Deltaproteobacteria bacterium]
MPASTSSLRSIIFAVASGQFFLPFLMAGVMTILPAIGNDMQASAMELSLIGAVYSLSLAIFHLIAGRIGDIMGRRRLFLIGFGLLIVMTGLMTMAPDIPTLLGLRFVQAAGTGIMNTTALAILVSSTPPAILGRVLSLTSLGLYLGISLSPPIAGFITATLGWRWLFGLIVPLALPAWMLMALTVKGEWYEAPDDPFDWPGCLTYAASITMLAVGATWIASSWWAWALIGAGLIGLWAFIRVEQRSTRPLVDIGFTLRNRALSLGLLSAFINFGSTFGGLFYFSMYVQHIHGLNPYEAGIFLGIQPVAQMLLAPLAGRLSDKYGAERMATLGIGLCGASLLLATQIGLFTSLHFMAAVLVVGGCGMALFGPSNTVAIMSSVDEPHLSQASGLVGSVRTLGMLANMVLISMIMLAYLGHSTVTADNAPVFMQAMHCNFVLLGLFNLVGFACSLSRLLRREIP